jgi:hypothetical protein
MAIGFRGDNNPFADAIFNREYSNAIISKDWNRFIAAIKVYV